MRRVRVGDSSGKVRLLRPVAPFSQTGEDEPGELVVSSGWRGHRAEILVVAAIWLLAIVQVGLAVARGGAFTPDSTLALAFALVCPLVLLGFRRPKDPQ